MLTNKAKQTAETIREQVAQLLEVSADFGKIYERKAREHWRAAAAWYAWQHFKEYEARTSTPEEAAKAEETHNTNPREWVATVEQKSGEKERARVALYVARVNLINNLNETAERVAELARRLVESLRSAAGLMI